METKPAVENRFRDVETMIRAKPAAKKK